MRLSQLEMKGFKSFADETIINFNEQVIGVVGPNGSGKSNIVDAIKWVLGEQKTKELRLDSMSDVIFAGTKKRKPGKIARVTVNFNNTKNILPTEYNNVSISRLLYSNGQSEYRLNDVQCRKKDITSLFLDSGLGSNAYAIISLSMVEDILVDRENSRGRMIEEASGINKFKVRKRETLNKLKGTQADLDRVEDLLFELESNLKAFEKQARRTERYLKVKEEFKLVSLSWATRNGRKLKADIDEIKKKLDEEIKEEVTLTSDLNTKESTLQSIKKEVLEKEGKLSEFQRKHNKLKEQISSLESEKGIAQNELTFLNSGLDKAEKESEILKKEVSLLKKELNEKEVISKEQLQILNTKRTDYSGKMHAFNAVKEVYDSIRENLVSGQKEKDEIRNKIEKSKRDISVKQSQIGLLKEQLQLKKQEERTAFDQLEKLKKEMNVAAQKLEKSTIDFESYGEEVTNIEGDADEISKQIEKLKEEVRQTELKRDKSKQRAEILENVINNYEGFTESIQFLNLESKISKQLISDVVEILNDEYQDIIELFFAPVLQHVIVNEVETAFTLNQIVKGAQKGKINFFINTNPKEASIDAPSDEFTPLLDLISFDAEYRNVFSQLCNNVFVFEDSFEQLMKIDLPDEMTILLSNELLIYREGELRGGSATLFEGVNIGRRKNLDLLKDQIESLEHSISDKTKKIAELSVIKQEFETDLQEKRENLTALREVLKKLESEKNVVETRYAVKSNMISDIQSKNEGAADHIKRIEKELDALSSLSESFSETSMKEDNIEEMKSDFNRYHQEFEVARNEKDAIYQDILKIENQFNLTARDIEQLTKTILEKEQKLIENQKTKEHNTIRIDKLFKQLEDIKEQVVHLYANEKEQFQKLNSQEEEFFTTKSGIYDKEKEIFELRGKREKANHIIINLKDKLNEKNSKLTNWSDRIEVEFNENINKYEVPEDYTDIDLDDLGVRRENLQLRIKSFGDINPLAIEAYNEIKLRVEKITEERDDILNAKINLEETIKDIENTASELFTESLDKIRVHFKEVFRSLFSEDDDCDIVLLNADSPLDSSIEIVAKPKGKKPKSINQLSGGEKTLTAVSFLFALYLLKPAPFCIFDEVDAPLDDVNIQKFNNIIRDFSKDSQFIIVTHNKATMAEMDILYGVFMQEAGVSGVAAVDFREFNKIDLFSKN